MTLALAGVFVLASFLLQSNSAYTFADQDSENKEILSPSDSLDIEEEMQDMKEIDMLNNIDGSFVNDQK